MRRLQSTVPVLVALAGLTLTCQGDSSRGPGDVPSGSLGKAGKHRHPVPDKDNWVGVLRVDGVRAVARELELPASCSYDRRTRTFRFGMTSDSSVEGRRGPVRLTLRMLDDSRRRFPIVEIDAKGGGDGIRLELAARCQTMVTG